MSDAIETILTWYDRNMPGGREALQLRGPAKPAAIARLEKQVGSRLPAATRAFWLLHDGQEPGARSDLFGARWLSVAEAGAMWSSNCGYIVPEWTEPAADTRLVACVFHLGRIPWAGDLAQLAVLVDLAPGPTGTVGQVIVNVTECEFAVIGTGLDDLLARFARLAAAGLLEVKTPRGSPPSVRAYGTDLWDVLALPPPPPVRTDPKKKGPLDRWLVVDRYGTSEDRPVAQWLELVFEKMVAPDVLVRALRSLAPPELFAILRDAHARTREVPVPAIEIASALLARLDDSNVDEAVKLLGAPSTAKRAALGSFLLTYLAQWSSIPFKDAWLKYGQQLRARAPNRRIMAAVMARFSAKARAKITR